MSYQVMVKDMMEDILGKNGVAVMKTSSTALSPIPCLDGVAVTPKDDTDNSNDANGESMDFKDELKEEFEDVKDELETEQVDDELVGDRITMKSPLKKDAFELVDEFSDTVEESDKKDKVNGDIPSSSSSERKNTDKELVDNIKNSLNSEDTEIATVEENVEEETPSDINEEISETTDSNGAVNPLDIGDVSESEEVVGSESNELIEEAEVFEECEDSNEDTENQELEEDFTEDVDVDPLMAESDVSEQENISELESKPGKRKNLDAEDTSSVKKSSRLRTKVETEIEEDSDKPKEKQKMLQKPDVRPNQVEEEEFDMSDSETAEGDAEEEDTTEPTKREGEQSGDPTRDPGEDAVRRIDQDLLLPFHYGWSRECVFRAVKAGPTQVDVYYWPPKDGADYGPRNREARRKRRSKVDQERYFEEFTHKLLSVNNFTYVRRALGLNNEAYEMVRYAKPGLETRSDKNRRATKKVANYKEIAEHEGLVSSSQSEGEESEPGGIEEVTEFDIGLPLTLQVQSRVTPLREEHKKRRQWPDRERCVTPPLASDMPWTHLDDDPLGVYTELYSELEANKCPPTPPPLRALRLTSHKTTDSIADKLQKIRSSLPDPLARITAGNTDLAGSDHLASHDLAVRKFKNYRPPQSVVATHARQQMKGGLAGARRAPPPHRQAQSPVRQPGSPVQGFVKVRLPMPSTNGKRPVVELVMLTNGKYQPIKFTNNRQVTESIPKRLFDQANLMRKTLYQRSVQVPKIGTKQVFLAINPTPGGVRPYSSPQQRPVQQTPDQVSILVRPAGGGNAVLLNVPRSVALKVKVGTTLSFSASNDQKYTVLDNKMHPPVGRQKPAAPARQLPPPRLPSLPSGVSIRPVASGAIQGRSGPVATGRPMVAAANPRKLQQRPATQARPRQATPSQSRPSADIFNFTPCSPFCPGVSGIPELECTQCHSLFHPKCVNIPQWQVANIQHSFKCKRCAGNSGRTEVIDLD
eukprot:GFUD01003061.1.p1 GENE.GFUD01003061.1~~GFUD01003061.1.p1  ORF type:complete len:982 (-),score=335.32 GFUD01003061.1:277-3222(-)